MSVTPLALRGRVQTFGLVVGVVVGVLVTGLVLPFAVGERTAALPSANGGQDGLDLGKGVGPAGGTGSFPGDSTTAGPGGASAPAGAAGGAAPGAGLGGSGGTGPAAGSTTTDGQPGGVGAPAGAGRPRTASDVGVSAEEIKLGVITPDTTSLQALGYPADPGDAPGQWRHFINQINASGGISGRKIKPFILTVDVTNGDAMNAACKSLTQDDKVFAVLSTTGFYGPPVLCIVQQNKTPFFDNDGQPLEWQKKLAPGRLFTLPQDKNRTLLNYVDFLDRVGALKGKKIGLLDIRGFDGIPVNQALKPLLKQRGYTLCDKCEYTFSDQLEEAAQQMGIAAQQLKTAGVEVVLPALNFLYATQFVQAAEGVQYFPKYYTSDFAGGASDFFARHMPASWDGAVGVTAAKLAGQYGPQEKACLDSYATGGRRESPSSPPASHVVTVCAVAKLFAAGATQAGVQLTRASFATGMATLGKVQIPGYGGGTFVNGKYDAADLLQVVQWSKACTCYQPVKNAQFFQSRY